MEGDSTTTEVPVVNSIFKIDDYNDEIRLMAIPDTSFIPLEFAHLTKSRLSSVYTSGTVYKPKLTVEQEKYLLADYINAEYGSREYGSEVKKFWAEFSISVPSGGALLNIGLNEEGYPINTFDYIRFRFLLTHPNVAPNQKIAQEQQKGFYIFDDIINSRNIKNTTANKVDTMVLLQQHKDDTAMLKIVLKVVSPNLNVSNYSDSDLYNLIYEMIDSKTEEVKKAFKSPKSKAVAFINELYTNNLITKSGTTYFYKDKILGDSMIQVIATLEAPDNSELKMKLRAELKQKSPNSYLV